MFISGYYSDRLDFSSAKDVDFDAIAFPQQGLLAKLGIDDKKAFNSLLEQSFADYLLAFELFCGEAV